MRYGDGREIDGAVVQKGRFCLVEIVGGQTIDDLVEAGGIDVLRLLVGEAVEADIPSAELLDSYVTQNTQDIPLVSKVGIRRNEEGRCGDVRKVIAVRINV